MAHEHRHKGVGGLQEARESGQDLSGRDLSRFPECARRTRATKRAPRGRRQKQNIVNAIAGELAWIEGAIIACSPGA